MTEGLTRAEVSQRVDELLDDLEKEACRTCDCLQGYLTQLEMDAAEDVSDIIEPLKVDREQMHGCLGCDPCVPGEHFARYIRG
jgi:hypothetical protein